MFKKKQLLYVSLFVLFAAGLAGCKGNFEKLRAGNDVGKKYQEALRLYNKKKYSKALILFDDLNKRFRGQAEAEDLAYYFAYTNYHLRDYTTARYEFKQFADTYPGSPKTEECRFMSAYCYYLESPTFSLDQENTQKAIESLQLFINLYPKSDRVAEASRLITDLRNKLEDKAFANAKLYLTTGVYNPENYRAAVIAFKNVLRDFPDIRYAEEIEFLSIKAQFLFAENSVETRQEERYGEVVSMSNDFAEKYPSSKFFQEAADLKKDAEKGIAKAKSIIAAEAALRKEKSGTVQDTTVKN
jgi:outer membrane protein assembly factor BamD